MERLQQVRVRHRGDRMVLWFGAIVVRQYTAMDEAECSMRPVRHVCESAALPLTNTVALGWLYLDSSAEVEACTTAAFMSENIDSNDDLALTGFA